MPTPEEQAAAKAAEDQKIADELKAKTEADAKAKAEADAKTQEKKFSQAELDAIIQDRLTRANDKAAKDREAEKAKAEAAAAEKNGEWQKLAEVREKESADAKLAAEAAQNELQTVRIESAFLSEAAVNQFGEKSDMHFINPKAALKLADRKNVTIDGETVTGALDALKAVAKDNPYMLDKPPASIGPGSPVKGQRAPLTPADLSKQPRPRY